jgi:aminoglycoside phosphotransferase (APT) family kinase protein
VRRTPLELAAIATAAVPGLRPTAVSASPDDATDFDAALLETADGRTWRIRCPRGTEASARLETEMTVLRAFDPSVRAELPFQMPAVAGTVRMGDLTTCVYTNLTGAVRDLDALASGSGQLAREIGGTLAAIHGLPQDLVDGADLPSYTANGFRQRRLNELDQAATTGKIPPILLRRWEQAMEDVTLWRFNPTVVHGDLHEDNLLIDDDRVTAVTGWTDLRIGDPADDIAWLVGSNEPKFIDAVLAAYHEARKEPVDPQLARRAALAAEFALAQYLVKALALGDGPVARDAEDMLAELAADIEASEAAEAREARETAGASIADGSDRATGSDRAGSSEAAGSTAAAGAPGSEARPSESGRPAEGAYPARSSESGRPDGASGVAPRGPVAEPATDAIPIVSDIDRLS